MRVLVVSPFTPSLHAAHGAPRAIAGMLGVLSTRHSVSLIHVESPGDPPVEPALRNALATVRAVPTTPAARPLRRLRLGGRLLAGTPMWVQATYDDRLRDAVLTAVTDLRPDVVQVELSVLGPLVDDVKRHTNRRTPVVFVVHDPAWRGAGESAVRRHGADRLLHTLDTWAWWRTERAAIDASDVVVTFTDDDIDDIPITPVRRSKAVVVPLGVADVRPADPAGTDDATVLFIGGTRHPPNVDAIERLRTRIMPIVATARPDARLLLVGEGTAGHDSAGVEAAGRVDDVHPYLVRANVVVAPLRTGGGMRVKVLEALAAGKAVVGTGVALAGTSAVDHHAAIRADDDHGIATAIVRLLDHPAERVALGQRAAAHARDHLSWDSVADRFGALYDRLARMRDPIGAAA